MGEPTYSVTVYMAGDVETAKRWLRRECYERGLCVTVRSETFIYTGGEEQGFAVGLVNYPRFPSTPEAIFGRAREISEALLSECCQRSALVVGSDKTEWIQVEAPGERT